MQESLVSLNREVHHCVQRSHCGLYPCIVFKEWARVDPALAL
jgi:hypothetical protein